MFLCEPNDILIAQPARFLPSPPPTIAILTCGWAPRPADGGTATTGRIRVDGTGSRLTIGGVLTTDNASDLLITNGGYLEARHMVLDNTYGVAGYEVDAQSTLEVGTLGNAAAGTWTIDPTRMLTIEKSVRLSAPEFVVNGWIDDIGELDLTGRPAMLRVREGSR
jgi:hypothetical protein